MTTALVEKLTGVRDFKKILETTVKELGEMYAADVSQIVLSNPLDRNLTSICEYRAFPDEDPGDIPNMTFPLPLQGGGIGMLSMARREPMSEDEINYIRVTLAELCDIVRHAQINDVVQRDTFRDTFLVEIGNVMNYSLGIGDALFMVVNILGKVLNTSRCLFICVDDTQAGWKCYEFWQRDRVQSCQEFMWPTTDSPIIAQALLSKSPLLILEGSENSYMSPVQEELQLIGVRSLLGVPLKSADETHGCIILQQCDSRHAWTRGEIDMVQNVADTVAEALSRLPQEKRSREPIMRLHQRDVAAGAGEEKESILAVRRALRGALGQQSIPSAQKTSAPSPPKPAQPAAPAATIPAVSPAQPVPPAQAQPAAAWGPAPPPPPPPPAATPQSPPRQAAVAASTPSPLPPPAVAIAGDIGALADVIVQQAGAGESADELSAAASLNSLLGGLRGTSGEFPKPLAAGQAQPVATAQTAEASSLQKWDNLDLEAVPTPATADRAAAQTPAPPSAWGNLDDIPTPSSGPARAGLGGAMLSKGKGSPAASSPLMASLHRDKSRFPQPTTDFVEGPPLEIDEAQAQAKIQQVLSSSNPTSDYIFALPGLDARMLGRIDGWISQVEQKDRYTHGHSVPAAEYSVAIARLIGLPQQDVDNIRLAAVLHDVGKLGLSPQLLQKNDDDLSDTELLMIMKHPIDGANLLESFPELAHLAPIVLSHHEEYDGNGYPAGLSGEEIPLAARIINVSSSYHGLVSPTRYRAAMSAEDAMQALRMGSGKAFDPNLVEALIACIHQGLAPAAFA